MLDFQMTSPEPSGKGLVYNGTAIRDKGEMLSLTDMWKASGSPEAKRPANWSRKEGADFIAHVSMILNMPVGHIQTSRGGSGSGRGATFAHWQIAIAYAKYLSHEFHMWCNSVVRAAMEGKPVGATLPAEVLEQIERSFGIMRMVAHKVTELEKALPGIVANMVEPLVAARLASSAYLLRAGKTAKQIWDACGLPPNIKGSAVWFGNRLKKGGCMLEGRADRGDRAIRLFDPDKAEALLELGLRQHSRSYASNRLGKSTDGLFAIQGGMA
ncbi:KilA-N domain-containing protein [Pseudogemmobacter bohemicus]|uniref:KilA-N domain-containing protein n=1 Tax=Pseudogemmobacter bohemicus TaxID=2250708 RepID=UPI000DD43F6D|nr:KilA-N domain-containing protein [Pseudogemmobacter bohemicus]